MAILAVCPYCREGKVRAPIQAVGLSATCPRCANCFMIIKSEEAPPRADRSPLANRSPLAPNHSPVCEDNPHRSGMPTPHVPIPKSPSGVRRKAAKEEEPPPKPASPSTPGGSRSKAPRTKVLALVAISLGGVGLAASQLPFGQITAPILAGLGLLFGLLAWHAAQGRWPGPVSASTFNFAILLVLALMPGWLGLASWWPAPADDSKALKFITYDGIANAPADEWLDVTKGSWQRDDVRVSFRSGTIGPVVLKGPNKQDRKSDKKYLQIWVRAANEGLARMVEFKGWGRPTASEATAPRLTGPDGKAIPLKTFSGDWQPETRTANTVLFPGKSAVELLIFEPPARNAGPYRLELPAAAFGEGGDPVRFSIPASSIEDLR